MAHKHNRRRIRPRSRRNNSYQFESSLPTVYEHDSGYESISSLSSLSSPRMSYTTAYSIPYAQSTMSSGPASMFADQTQIKRWLELGAGANVRRSFSDRDSRTLEYETDLPTMRKFGGEPADGYGLCDKMQEMFDSIGSWMEV